jgi:hypothetical protein
MPASNPQEDTATTAQIYSTPDDNVSIRTFRKVYDDFWEDSRHKNREYRTYARLLKRYNPKEGGAWEAEKTIANAIHLSIDSVRRALATLAETGWIEKANRFDRKTGKVTSNFYRFPKQFPDAPKVDHPRYHIITLNTPAKQKAALARRENVTPDDPHKYSAKQATNGADLHHSNGADLPHKRDLRVEGDSKETFFSPTPFQWDEDQETEGDSAEVFNGEQNLGAKDEEGLDLSDDWFTPETLSVSDDDFLSSPSSDSETGAESEVSRLEWQTRFIVGELARFTNIQDKNVLAQWGNVLRRRIKDIGYTDCDLIRQWFLHRHFNGAPYQDRANKLSMDQHQYPHLVFLLYGEKNYPEFLAFAREWRAKEPDRPFIRRRSYFDAPPPWYMHTQSARVSDEEGIQYCQDIERMLTQRMVRNASDVLRSETTHHQPSMEEVEEEEELFEEEAEQEEHDEYDEF